MKSDKDIEDSKTDSIENQGHLFLWMWGRVKVGLITTV